MQDITYTIKVNDLIEALKEHEYVKIEFYKDGDFTIMDENACGYPDESIHTEPFDLYDFKDCNSDVNEYTDWLEDVWFKGLEVSEYNEFQNTRYVNYTIRVNWVK